MQSGYKNGVSGRKMLDLLLFLPDDQRQYVYNYCSSLSIPNKLTEPHELIKYTKQYLKLKNESTTPRRIR